MAGEPLYFDHAASAPMAPKVLELYRVLGSTYGNPSATGHLHGARARALVERAREQVAELAGADAGGVLFTSGTTEANHLALHGLLGAKLGHAVTTAIEHPAVSEALAALERRGLECVRVGCARDGCVDPHDVARACRPDTRLVSVMHGNNETGALADLEAVRSGLPAGAFFHVDAAQSARTELLDAERMRIDCLALGAHKLGGPKGVGALVCSPRALRSLEPVLRGGGQERGLRGGTVNAPAIAAFGLACELARRGRDARRTELRTKSEALYAALRSAVPTAELLGPPFGPRRLPGIVTVRIPGVRATLLQAEVRHEVSLATGSACATTKVQASHVLTALGLSDGEALEVIRLSLSPETTRDEIAVAAAALGAAVARLTRSAVEARG